MGTVTDRRPVNLNSMYRYRCRRIKRKLAALAVTHSRNINANLNHKNKIKRLCETVDGGWRVV